MQTARETQVFQHNIFKDVYDAEAPGDDAETDKQGTLSIGDSFTSIQTFCMTNLN